MAGARIPISRGTSCDGCPARRQKARSGDPSRARRRGGRLHSKTMESCPRWRPCWWAKMPPAKSTCATSGPLRAGGHREPAVALGGRRSQDDLLALIAELNKAKDEPVHGILVQLPLPPHIDTARVLQAISPLRTSMAFTPTTSGRMVQGQPAFLRCTPLGVQQLLLRDQSRLPGGTWWWSAAATASASRWPSCWCNADAGADATVTVCHSRTPDLASLHAAGRHPGRGHAAAALHHRRHGQAGAQRVVDVGIHRRSTASLVGDVDFASVSQVAGHITPVPGGVGPLTVTMLLVNTLSAARLQE